MSTSQAIAAVTAVLVEEAKAALPDFAGVTDLITASSPPLARGNRTDPQVNLFLYQIAPDAAWRNQDVPGKPGTAYPLLALRLHFLVTAFGQNDDDRQGHDLLGAVMLRFHTAPILPRTGADPVIGASGLGEQYEPVRLTLQPLTVDELSKLWAGSPTPYRLSVGYEAAVVLIDSGKPARSAPPVLGRADNADAGFEANPMAGNPTIEGLRFPLGLPGIRIAAKNLGVQKWVPDELTLNGRSLDHSDLRLVFRHLRLGFTYIAKPATAKSPGSLAVRVPHDLTVYRDQPSQSLDAIEVAANEVKATDPTSWPPGVYTVSAARAVKTKQVFDRLFTTSPVAFGMVPDIDTSSAPFAIAAGPPAALSIKLAAPVRVSPTGEVLQQVRTFAGGLELNGRATSGDGLTLNWEAADSVKLKSELKAATDRGELLLLRVQVDGVDSSMLKPPVGDALAPPREFDPALIVTVP